MGACQIIILTIYRTMSGAESASTNFVVGGNVHENNQTFSPQLYNNVGAVTGYPGPDTGVAAAAGNPGPKIVMKGGNSRAPAAGPNYHAFVDSGDVREGVFANQYAPVVVENNNKQVGGKKRRKSRRNRKSKKYHKKTKSHNKKSKTRSKRRNTKKRKTMKKRGMLTNIKNLFGMKGGNPANFTPDPSVPSDRQYMTNQAFTNSYTQGGELEPKLNALANPTLTTPTNNC